MTSVDPLIEGILPVDKPVGPTSHDIVALARRGLRTRRVGHTGTLDPFASGLMLLCVGRATRIAEYLSGMDKTYVATIRLGVATDTDDHTGAVIASVATDGVDRDAVETVLARQRGSIMQLPPAYSAKKQHGERAYAAARAGRTLVLSPVPVHIRELTVTAFALPDVTLRVTCSTGTYIRAIARDVGADLGVGAHLAALRRTAVGAFGVEDALPVDALADPPAVQQHLMTPARAMSVLGMMPVEDLAAHEKAAIRHGRPIPMRADRSGRVALVHNGELIAIAEARDGLLHPRKVLA